MCRLIEADWFLHAENQNSTEWDTGCRNKEEYFRAIISSPFLPRAAAASSHRETLFAPAVIVVVVLPSLYQNAFCQSRCERKKIFAAPYSLRFVCLYHSHLLYNGSLREISFFNLQDMLQSSGVHGGYETCILWKIMMVLTKSKHFQRIIFSRKLPPTFKILFLQRLLKPPLFMLWYGYFFKIFLFLPAGIIYKFHFIKKVIFIQLNVSYRQIFSQ